MPINLCTTTNTPQSHKIGISAPHAFLDPPTAAPASVSEFQIISNNHVRTPETVEDDGNSGSPWVPSEGVVFSKESGSGAVTMRPRADDLRTILPLIFGGVFAGDELKGDFICDYFSLEAEKGVAVFHHINCKTNTASFTSSSTSPILQMEWGIESCRYSRTAAGSFTAGLNKSVQQPFVHTGGVLTVDGTDYKMDDLTLAVNNNLSTDLYYNCPFRTDLPMGQQEITLTHTSPFNEVADLALMDFEATSVSARLEYTAMAGAVKLTFDFPALQSPISTPITPSGNSPVQYEGITWTARTTGTGATLAEPVTITLDDNPA